MADFEEAQPRPLVLICGTLSTKDTGGFLAHFKGLGAGGDRGADPGRARRAASAEEVAEFAARAGLAASRRDQRRRGARRCWPPRLAEAAAHPDRRLALSRRRVLEENGCPPS